MDNEESKSGSTEPKVDSTSEELTRLYASESETEVAPTTRVASAPKTSSLQIPKKKSGTGKKVALALLMLLVLVGLGALAYWQYSVAQNAQSEKQAAQSQLTDKNTQLSSLQAKYADLQAKDDKSSTTPVTLTDDQQIKQAVTAKAHTVTANEKATITVTISKKTTTFARATVSTGDGGYYCITKKVDSVWVVLLCGQDAPTQADIDMYSIPADIAKG